MKVLVTRAAEGAARLSASLRRAGFDPVECPLIRTEPIAGEPVDLVGYDWLVFTSRAAVDYAQTRLRAPWPAVAAIGPGTAEALHDIGVVPELVSQDPSQEGLLDEFPPEPGRVVFAGAEGARPLLAERLRADTIVLYRTVELAPADVPDADVAVLASPSAARALARRRRDIPCVSIGQSTTQAALDCGLEVVAEATRSDLDGLVTAVCRAAEKSGEGRT